MVRISELGECGLIQRISRCVRTGRDVLRGIGDDCAVLRWRGSRLLLFASDMLVEGVHFRRSAPPEAVGWKALAVNVSDVAAMGGVPRHAVISLGLPRRTPVAWVDGLYRGLRRCAGRFRVNLVGGDTSATDRGVLHRSSADVRRCLVADVLHRSSADVRRCLVADGSAMPCGGDRAERIVIAVAILGEVERNRVAYRSGARPGDILMVTGRLGGAVRSGRHLLFTPRVREARALGRLARLHAMIDLSDGLGQDLVRLCQASRVSAVLESRLIPRAPGCSLKTALNEGEDFELLMAAAPRQADRLLRWGRRNLRCGLHRIGRVVARRPGRPVALVDGAGTEISVSPKGFQHF